MYMNIMYIICIITYIISFFFICFTVYASLCIYALCKCTSGSDYLSSRIFTDGVPEDKAP